MVEPPQTTIRIASLMLIHEMRSLQRSYFGNRRTQDFPRMVLREKDTDAILLRLPEVGPADQIVALEPGELDLLRSLRENQEKWRQGNQRNGDLTRLCIGLERDTDRLLKRLLDPGPSLFEEPADDAPQTTPEHELVGATAYWSGLEGD